MDNKDVYMEIRDGRCIHPFDIRPNEININDIAHSLAQIVRYHGILPCFYSVADHSVFVYEHMRGWLWDASRYIQHFRTQAMLQALLHDAAEMIISDIPSPIKKCFPDIVKLEASIIERIYKHYDADIGPAHVQYRVDQKIEEIDIRAAHTEKRDILRSPNIWDREDIFPPYPDVLVPFSGGWKAGKKRFLHAFEEIITGAYHVE